MNASRRERKRAQAIARRLRRRSRRIRVSALRAPREPTIVLATGYAPDGTVVTLKTEIRRFGKTTYTTMDGTALYGLTTEFGQEKWKLALAFEGLHSEARQRDRQISELLVASDQIESGAVV